MRAKRILAVAVAAAAIGTAGCSAATPHATPTPTATVTASPTPTPTVDPLTAWVDDRLAGMTLEQKAASLLMLHAPGTDPAPLRALAEQGIAGLILLGDNVPGDPASLRALTDAVQVDPEARTLLAIDEEGGEVQRLPWDDAATPPELRDEPPAATQAAFARRGDLLAEAGIDVNFGIVADVTADPDSFIYWRVLGTDPAAAAERVAQAVAGERGRTASTLKHFPGHGAAPGDSHTSLPTAAMSLDEWRATTAPPFAAGIDAGAELVMTGHLAYPAVDPQPASLSPEWHRILRGELGFAGIVVSDDLLMLQRNGLPEFADPAENAVRAVAAGTDLLLYVLPADPSEVGFSIDAVSAAIADAVRSGRIDETRFDESVARVLAFRREGILS